MTLNEAQKAYEQAIQEVETTQANLHSARTNLLQTSPQNVHRVSSFRSIAILYGLNYEQAVLKVETAKANLHSARTNLLAIEKADYEATKAECTRRKATK